MQDYLIGQCCPDGIQSVAEGLTKSLEAIAQNYQRYATLKITPDLRDHGVPSHNVFKRVSGEDFSEFHAQVCESAQIARIAFDSKDIYESIEYWQKLFGKEFPSKGGNGNNSGSPTDGGFTPRQGQTIVGRGRFG
jgi:hypothetical protein